MGAAPSHCLLFFSHILLLLYAARFFTFLKNFASKTHTHKSQLEYSNSISIPQKVGHKEKDRRHPKQQEKKRTMYDPIYLISIQMIFLLETYLCCALPSFMSHPQKYKNFIKKSKKK